MSQIKRYIFFLTFFFSPMFLSTMSHAVDFDGMNFPDSINIEGSDTTLQLNGIGYRTKFVFDIYVGGLYTESKVSTRDEAIALDGPNRIMMKFVYSEVDKEKLVNGWLEGFENNDRDGRVAILKPKIERFNEMFDTLVEGDEVLLDYAPGRGTRVTIKGEVKGTIEGKDFNEALLDIWLGEDPADGDLKDAMLGQ